MNDFSCYCNCKCWGDCYDPEFTNDEICGDCECHGTGLDDDSMEESENGESIY